HSFLSPAPSANAKPDAALLPSPLPAVETYDQLLREVREIRKPVTSLTKQGLVRQAWTLGKLIENHAATHQMWSDYDGYINSKLALDSGIPMKELEMMRRFARLYPDSVPVWNVSW